MIKTIISPQYQRLKGFITNLPQLFPHSGETIFRGRNIIKVFDYEGTKINVKYFKKPLLINQLIYTILRPSKAKRSYFYAQKIKDKGFNTPDPIAYIERRRGLLLKHSLYVSIQEQFDGLLQELRYGNIEDKIELIHQFAQFTANLHENKILHLDYSSGNILYKIVDDKYKFYLVDLNRMEFDRKISLDTACFNFRRLWGSDEMISLIVREYAKARNFDEKLCLEKTFKYREKFWKVYLKKYPETTPYIG